ncbi:MAG: molecular chaperone HtpG, partial [Coriobacteriales bacterium]
MRKFKTESRKLLDLMINSVYTNREIFLRELVSNASDAVDKLYFRGLTDSDVNLGSDELQIEVSFDKDARTVTVSDTGIGMDGDELEKNLGTIAHSGSQEFSAEHEQSAPSASSETDEADDDLADTSDDVASDTDKKTDIIGQFGVGFYSAFMVAKHVKVVSRPYGSDQAWVWESSGVEGYTITEGERSGHGTDVILTLKDNTDTENYDEFLSEGTLQRLIRTYSNYVRYPIRMEVTKSRELPKPDDAGDDYVPQYEDYTEVETINSMVPIWRRRKSEVSDEEYNEFYKSNFHDFSDPLRTIRIHAEGKLNYDALLFIPSRRPYDLYSKDYKKGLALYSSGVLIMENCEDLLPDCFNFVHGIVDSEDLTLNISRETLQQNSQLRAIARRVEKKIKQELASMRDNDRETYEKFFENFGRGIKYSLYSGYGMQKDLLADLLLFYSAREKKMVTLDEYVEAAQPDQESIFYAAGDAVDRLAQMPIVTTVLGKGYDVLLCAEDVDEFCMSTLVSYGREGDEKTLKNVAGGDLGLETEAEKDAAKAAAEENSALLEAMKNVLGDKVSEVTVSTRLTDAPACITAKGPISLEMERVVSALPNGEGVKSERVLELNAGHPVFESLKAAQALDDSDKIERYTKLLYDQALLVEGLPIDDPVEFS